MGNDVKQKQPIYDKVCKHDVNDVSWYVANEQILRDAGSFSYANLAGLPFSIDVEGSIPGAKPKVNNYDRVPGIAVLRLAPTIGISENAVSAVNAASRAIYSFVRHANSGSRNYESPDLMIYLLAMANAYAYLGSLIRLYGTLRSYPKFNRFVPKSLIKAQGYDYEDMQLHIADLRALINVGLTKLQSLAVPTGMSIFARYLWLSQNYMMDANSAKAQIYIPVFSKYYKFNPTKRDTGGCLEFCSFTLDPTAEYTFGDIVVHMNQILEPILSDEDMNIMSGDILKAYKTDIYNIQLIPEDFYVTPIHSLEVLSQIQNATLLDAEHFEFRPGVNDIYQEDGYIKFKPTYCGEVVESSSGSDFAGPALSKLFTMYKDEVTPGDTMVASRLTTICNITTEEFDTVTRYAISPITCGSEVLLSIEIQSNPNEEFFKIHAGYDVQADDPIYNGATVLALSRMTKFDMFPAIYLWSGNACYGPLQDVDNYTVMTAADLTKLHDAAMINMFSTKKLTNV